MDNKPDDAVDTECLRIPLIVGVTGHIDIATPEEQVRKAMEEFWTHLDTLFNGPETAASGRKTTRFILLSSLACGADHLAVKYRPADVEYCAVLPFDPAEYKKDFPGCVRADSDDAGNDPVCLGCGRCGGCARMDFFKDLRDAYRTIVCDAERGDYSKASDFVRSHSDFILSLWDGWESLEKENGLAKHGGTYEQIRAAFNMDDRLEKHQEKQHGVVNIRVTRKSGHASYEHELLKSDAAPGLRPEILNLNPKDGTFTASPFAEWASKNARNEDDRDDDREKDPTPSIVSVVKQIRGINSEIPAEYHWKSYLRSLLKPTCGDENGNAPRNDGVPAETKEEAWREIRADYTRYDYHDTLAGSHQRKHRTEFRNIAILSFIVGLLGQAWGDLTFSPDEVMHERILHGVILLYLTGCLCAWLYYRRILKHDHYSAYVGPRVIAELMRLKMFWSIARIPGDFFDLIRHECSNYWVALPVCNWEIADRPPAAADDIAGRLKLVREAWMEDQAAYYRGYLLGKPSGGISRRDILFPQDDEKMNCSSCPKSKREKCRGGSVGFPQKLRNRVACFLNCLKRFARKYERLNAWFNAMKNFFFWSAFFLAIFLLLVFILVEDHGGFLNLAYYREFVIGICPFIVSTIGWLLEKKNWDAQAREYRRMYDHFRKAIGIMQDASVPVERKQDLIRELMKICHQENSTWKELKDESGGPEPMI